MLGFFDVACKFTYKVITAARISTALAIGFSVLSVVALFAVPCYFGFEPSSVSQPPTSPVDILALAEVDHDKARLRSEFERLVMADNNRIWRKYLSTESVLLNWAIRRLYFVDSEYEPILSSLVWSSRRSSCAVVGNDGRIKNAAFEIDAHEAVFRLDNVPITDHVGRKTNVTVGGLDMLSGCWRMRNVNRYKSNVPSVVYLSDLDRAYMLYYCEIDSNIILTDPHFDLLSMKIAKYYSLKRWFKEDNRTEKGWIEEYNGKFHYSSGLQAVILAYASCQKISLYGFSLDSAMTDNCDYEAEMAFYRDLASSPMKIPFLNKLNLAEVKVGIY